MNKSLYFINVFYSFVKIKFVSGYFLLGSRITQSIWYYSGVQIDLLHTVHLILNDSQRLRQASGSISWSESNCHPPRRATPEACGSSASSGAAIAPSTEEGSLKRRPPAGCLLTFPNPPGRERHLGIPIDPDMLIEMLISH